MESTLTNGQTTTAATTTATTTCEDTIWSLSLWMAPLFTDDELFELGITEKAGREQLVNTTAKKFFEDFGSVDVTLISLLECLNDPQDNPKTKELVRLSAMRNAVTNVIEAYLRFTTLAPAARIGAYKRRLENIDAMVAERRAAEAGRGAVNSGSKKVAAKV